MPWWIRLHIANLALFPLFGLSAYVLVKDLRNRAAALSRIAIAAFVPLYAAFDALAGVGTGILVQSASGMEAPQRAAAETLIDAYWGSAALNAVAAAASIAWVIALLAAAVAFASAERRKLTGIVAIVLFLLGGWAETNLFLPSRFHIPLAWWAITIGSALAMFVASRFAWSVALLTLSASLFGASHVPPTGPLGAACFLAAAAYLDLTGESGDRH
jgi:hypothetical protein